MSIDEYFGDWSKVIPRAELLKVMNTLNTLYNTKRLCPLKSDVFKAFKLCSYSSLKAVFIGQDPYNNYINNKPVATGIAFANKTDTLDSCLSPSLQVIKEAVINFELPHICVNFVADLESWCNQGILMINTALTCEEDKSGSHIELWSDFMRQLLINISKYNTGIVYVLFGREARRLIQYIGKYNIVLCYNHPAYYVRINSRMPHRIFKEINDNIERLNGTKIKFYEER